MVAYTRYGSTVQPEVIVAEPVIDDGGTTKWFVDWTGDVPAGHTSTDRVLVYPVGATAIDVTPNYAAGSTVTLTPPDQGSLAIISPVLPEGQTEYAPFTRVCIRYSPPAGADATRFVNAWTNTTSVSAVDNSIAFLDITDTPAAVTISVTTTATPPGTKRAIEVTAPIGAVSLNGVYLTDAS